MAPTTQTSHRKPAKGTFLMVSFYHHDWNDVSPELYTDNDSSILEFPGTWKSTTAMKVKLSPISGMLKEKSVKLTMLQDAFLSSISTGEAVERIYCKIQERSILVDGPSGELESTLTLFSGQVVRTIRNYRGKKGSVLIECKNWKSTLDIPVNQGVVEHHCINPFLRGKCALGLTESAFIINADIISVSGKTITVTDTNITTKLDNWWNRGTIKVGNKEIAIREWSDLDPGTFHMVRDIPSSWTGVNAQFLPGCDKEYHSDCTLHGNTEYFLGTGFSTPAYTPAFETGRSG